MNEYKTKKDFICLSSFDVSCDVLIDLAVGVCTALSLKYPSPFYPVASEFKDDEDYGNSVVIIHKHYERS